MGVTPRVLREAAALRRALSRAKQSFHETLARDGLRASDLLPIAGRMHLVPLSEAQAQIAAGCVVSSIDYREKLGEPLSREEVDACRRLLACLSMPFVQADGSPELDERLARWVHTALLPTAAPERGR